MCHPPSLSRGQYVWNSSLNFKLRYYLPGSVFAWTDAWNRKITMVTMAAMKLSRLLQAARKSTVYLRQLCSISESDSV